MIECVTGTLPRSSMPRKTGCARPPRTQRKEAIAGSSDKNGARSGTQISGLQIQSFFFPVFSVAKFSFYSNTTIEASNTGPSTHTRFIAGPPGRFTRTVQPAQPPTAQAMYSSSESCAGRP